MPKGPQGQKRPGDTVSAAVMVGKIATGDVEETAYAAPGRKRSGEAGGAARSHKLSSAERKAIANAAAGARWKEKDMSDKISDPLAGLLFGHERTLVNLKLLRGDAPHVTEKDLREEAHSALLQVQLGTADSHAEFPEDRNVRRVNVVELVTQL
jgi:hypothetical protein